MHEFLSCSNPSPKHRKPEKRCFASNLSSARVTVSISLSGSILVPLTFS